MKLKKIDLRKSVKHNHPDIKVGDRYKYLAILDDGTTLAGSFSREWYGLNFDWFWNMSAGLQFDAPGWNSSQWKELYQIIR